MECVGGIGRVRLVGVNEGVACPECVGVVAVCVEGNLSGLGRCSVRVGCCVLSFVVDMECGDDIARAYRGVNEGVAI